MKAHAKGWELGWWQPAQVWHFMMMVSFRPALGGVQQAVRGLSLPMLSLHCFLRSEVQYSFLKKLDVICTLWNMHEVQGTDFRLRALAWFILFHVLCTYRIQCIVVLHVCKFTLTINVTSECLYALYWSFSSWQLPGCFSCYSTIENHRSYKINFVYLDLQTSSWAYLLSCFLLCQLEVVHWQNLCLF